jgi:hypothetical protein
MSASQVLQEYLIALGFKVDAAGAKKTDNMLTGMDKKVWKLGKSLVAAAGAMQGMVAVFAFNMEKLYFASKRTGATVANIKALEYGAQQVGVSAGTITAALESMAKTMRMNPGMQALLNSLGVKVEGRDKSDVLKDLVKELAKMPHFVGAQFAEMFGIDEQTFLMLKEGIQQLERASELQKQMATDGKVDLDAAAAAGHEYANSLREITARAGILKDALMITLLPAFKEVAGVTNEVLKDWTRIMSDAADPNKESIWEKIKRSNLFRDKVTLSEGVRHDLATRGIIGPRAGTGALPAIGPAPAASVPALAASASATPSPSLFDRLEKQYGLPSGILDRMWATESGRGQHLVGPATRTGERAQGHFQFMGATAQSYGVNNPMDLEDSATGAAKYLRDLMRKYGGDIASAVAAYNWGPGNMDKYKLGEKRSMPAETEDYVRRVAGEGVVLHQDTKIYVQGGDSASTGRAVANEQRTVNSDLLRNWKGAVR